MSVLVGRFCFGTKKAIHKMVYGFKLRVRVLSFFYNIRSRKNVVIALISGSLVLNSVFLELFMTICLWRKVEKRTRHFKSKLHSTLIPNGRSKKVFYCLYLGIYVRYCAKCLSRAFDDHVCLHF